MVCILINKKQANTFLVSFDSIPATICANVKVINKLLFISYTHRQRLWLMQILTKTTTF